MTDRKIYIVNIRIIANRMQKVKRYANKKKSQQHLEGCIGYHKGDKENSYIVHFSDSAMISRAVARGYVTVNGKEVELTEDTKQQLLKTDKEASAAREKAYQDWLIVSRNSILP